MNIKKLFLDNDHKALQSVLLMINQQIERKLKLKDVFYRLKDGKKIKLIKAVLPANLLGEYKVDEQTVFTVLFPETKSFECGMSEPMVNHMLLIGDIDEFTLLKLRDTYGAINYIIVDEEGNLRDQLL